MSAHDQPAARSQVASEDDSRAVRELARFVPRPAVVPVSYAQQRIWFVDRLLGGSAQFNLVGLLRLRGEAPTPAVRFALAAVVARHESLRTRFAETDGEPRQVIDGEYTVDLPTIDVSGLDPKEQQQRIQQERLNQRMTPFNLTTGPLVRAVLIRLRPDEHVLVRTIHHIVCDGWSEKIFDQDVIDAFTRYRAGVTAPPPPLDVQYADFALWERGSAGSRRQAELLAYWRSQLDGLPEGLTLPAAQPARGPIIVGDVCHLAFSLEQTRALRRLAQQSHATVYITLLAIFAVLIARYAGDDDFAVGCPCATRPFPSLEGLVGLFINLMVIRVKVRPQLSFLELLAQVRRTSLQAYKHQDLPFERLVEELAPVRASGRAPLFRVMFGARTFPAPRPAVPSEPSVTSALVEQLVGGAQPIGYDLEVYVSDRGPAAGLSWFYNTDMFARSTIRRMTQHFVNLVEAAVNDPGQPVGRLRMMDQEERDRVLRLSAGIASCGSGEDETAAPPQTSAGAR